MLTSHELHFDAIVCDGHCDTLGDVLAGARRLHELSLIHISEPTRPY